MTDYTVYKFFFRVYPIPALFAAFFKSRKINDLWYGLYGFLKNRIYKKAAK